MKRWLTIVAILLTCMAFTWQQITPPPTPFKLVTPAGWPAVNPTLFKNNPPTVEGIALGKRLFYDVRLSKGQVIACASCHQSASAFATADHDFSHGINNSLTTRNAPPLFNLAWKKNFHWDGGINHLEVQPLAPLTAPNEMGADLKQVLQTIQQDTVYVNLFKKAFGTGRINTQLLLKALAQFTGTIQSYNSKYDQVQQGKQTFTKTEATGYQLFLKHCNQCHTAPLFTDFSYRNNGLSANPFLQDKGRMAITGQPKDSLKFMVPSLRNVTVTYPYMHDGRLYTLGKVLDHYSKLRTANHPTIDPLLQQPIPLNDADKAALLAFLATLRDNEFLHNPAYQAPTNLPALTLLHP